jgi:LuxR family maltose regulon positive regulatory protein
MLDPLTEREIELLRMLTTDLTRREIADVMCVSTNTIKTHFAAVFRKLGVNSRPAAVMAGQQAGLM